jgi:hypothetical protein
VSARLFAVSARLLTKRFALEDAKPGGGVFGARAPGGARCI